MHRNSNREEYDDNVNFKKDEIKCEIEHSPLIVDETKATNIEIVISDTVPNLGVEGTTEVLLTPPPPRDMATMTMTWRPRGRSAPGGLFEDTSL